jgi:cytochrome c6
MQDLKRTFTIACLAATACTCLLAGNSVAAADSKAGEAGFKEHCVACHADGGNMIKADKTLSRTDREKHGIKKAADIVRLMRKPGEGMTTFDKKTIPDKQAKAIADYIIKTFK